MTEYWFYHLEMSSVEAVLPGLLQKSRERGWRALVKLPASRLDEMDKYLWTYQADSFLPHGRSDEPLSDQQPIVLSSDAVSPLGAEIVILIEGETLENLDGVIRCITLINGRNDDHVQAARDQWASLKQKEAEMSYWTQNDEGRWQKLS